jgi:T-complex protein 1 subunit delta
MSSQSGAPSGGSDGVYNDKSKPIMIRMSNIAAAKAVADVVRTSLGPKGMDKMIQNSEGNVTITNDGATILDLIDVLHPAAKMLVQLSKAQDVEAGDGTTSVVVLAGSLLDACERLLSKGIHPAVISESFGKAAVKACEVLEEMSQPISLDDRDYLLKAASTSLNSKVVSLYSSTIAPIVVDAVLAVANREASSVDLNDIKIIRKLDGTVEDTELVHGVVFDKRFAHKASGESRMEKAKIGLIQFCLSPPKTDTDNQVVISDYSQMDRVLKEERKYILNLCKRIQKTGCNVLLVQKSILRDAVDDLALHFLAKMKILVVRDIERDDIEFISKSLGCKPVANADDFTADSLGAADLVEEVSAGSSKFIKVTGAAAKAQTASIIVRGSSELILSEAERSIHDALCVIRCLVKKRAVIAGGGAPEIECALQLAEFAKTLTGSEAYCVRAFADALEAAPFTLAENAGLNPISTVTTLRARHKDGEKTAGINVRKGAITNILEENVLQPLLVSTSAIMLATETVRSIMKIDDIVTVR